MVALAYPNKWSTSVGLLSSALSHNFLIVSPCWQCMCTSRYVSPQGRKTLWLVACLLLGHGGARRIVCCPTRSPAGRETVASPSVARCQSVQTRILLAGFLSALACFRCCSLRACGALVARALLCWCVLWVSTVRERPKWQTYSRPTWESVTFSRPHSSHQYIHRSRSLPSFHDVLAME